MINVIDNAIKYSVKNSIINLECYLNHDNYNIEISNHSEKPIPEEVYKNIFQPFIKSIKSDDEYSTGLGLFLCNEIIKDHNGSIIIENGNEVKVKITLPIK